ncbi:MAG: hypothetical protein P4N60_24515 [Verrucomicrobiae bacterium]|nr:hypothetical protein [Verrucomicrobiae bacterium]
MNLKPVIAMYLLVLAVSLFDGFHYGWKSRTLLPVGLATLSFVYAIFYFMWERRLVRRLAAMPPADRERKLAAMKPASRERIKKLLKSHAP